MLRQATWYGQTGICFVMTKTAMLKGKGQAVVEMKRFLKPRSGCGRPDLGENVHRKIFGENIIHNQSVSEIMTIAYGFFRLHKKRMRRHQRRRISHDFQRSEIFKPKNNYSKFK